MRFALTSLAVWRITHVLAEEDGPADTVLRLRARLGPGQLGELMDCFYCLSVWVAAPRASPFRGDAAICRLHGSPSPEPPAWSSKLRANAARSADTSSRINPARSPSPVNSRGRWGAVRQRRGDVPVPPARDRSRVTCCGHGRAALRADFSSAHDAGVPGDSTTVPTSDDEPLRLEPREQTTLYARGRATGRTYVFTPTAPGQLVHPADAPALLASGVFRVRNRPHPARPRA